MHELLGKFRVLGCRKHLAQSSAQHLYSTADAIWEDVYIRLKYCIGSVTGDALIVDSSFLWYQILPGAAQPQE